jgi:hypothetical protein
MLRSLVENDKTLSTVPIGKKDKEE